MALMTEDYTRGRMDAYAEAAAAIRAIIPAGITQAGKGLDWATGVLDSAAVVDLLEVARRHDEEADRA